MSSRWVRCVQIALCNKTTDVKCQVVVSQSNLLKTAGNRECIVRSLDCLKSQDKLLRTLKHQSDPVSFILEGYSDITCLPSLSGVYPPATFLSAYRHRCLSNQSELPSHLLEVNDQLCLLFISLESLPSPSLFLMSISSCSPLVLSATLIPNTQRRHGDATSPTRDLSFMDWCL